MPGFVFGQFAATPTGSLRYGIQREIITILGTNGAGKTTTMRTISQLLKAKAGSIRFKGQELTQLPAHKIVRPSKKSKAPSGGRDPRVLTLIWSPSAPPWSAWD